ncbi:MAG: hypothetical protein VW600_09565 [Ferrovibrio sp.]
MDMSRKTTTRQAPPFTTMLGRTLLSLAEACRDIRVISRAG